MLNCRILARSRTSLFGLRRETRGLGFGLGVGLRLHLFQDEIRPRLLLETEAQVISLLCRIWQLLKSSASSPSNPSSFPLLAGIVLVNFKLIGKLAALLTLRPLRDLGLLLGVLACYLLGELPANIQLSYSQVHQPTS